MGLKGLDAVANRAEHYPNGIRVMTRDADGLQDISCASEVSATRHTSFATDDFAQ